MNDQAELAQGGPLDDPHVALVCRFSHALIDKLGEAEKKHGWNHAWMRPNWRGDLLQEMLLHISKGDPVDVAAYCAFAWHHGWQLEIPAGAAAEALRTERHTAVIQRDAVRSSLALAEGRNTALAEENKALREQLRQDQAQFREYQRHHLAKEQPDIEKAERNAAFAERIGALLAGAAMASSSPFDQHRVFMEACGQTTSAPDLEQIDLYRRLIGEETEEFDHAREAGDGVEMADAILDIIVVTIGLGWSMGLPMQALWDEVLRSNMAKVGPDGTVTRREDGKILKPDGWTPPDILGVLRKHGSIA